MISPLAGHRGNMENVERKEIDCEAIRRAVIKYADSIGRPHFDVVIVREVVNSFIYGTAHHLKDAVKQFIGKVEIDQNANWNDLPKNEKRCRLLTQFLARSGMTAIVSKHTKICATYLGDLKSGRKTITDAHWQKLLDAFDDCEKEYKQKKERQLLHVKKKLNACGVKQ